MSPRIPAGPEPAIVAGEVRVVALPRERNGTPREALLLRDHDGVLRAYLNRCQHLPVPIDAGSRRFLTPDGQHLLCSTHGARYRLHDGYCVHGPCAGSALLSLPIAIEGGAVYLVLDD